MKVRNSFVSNSSSSSFIVAFERPIDAEYLKDLLYGGDHEIDYLYNWKDHRETFTSTQLAETIANDLKFVDPDALMLEKLSEDKDNFWGPDEELDEKCKFVSEHKGKFIYECEFSDNNGSLYSHLEHDDTFGNVPHLKFNHH
jgi:hypothetical protein